MIVFNSLEEKYDEQFKVVYNALLYLIETQKKEEKLVVKPKTIN